MKDSGQDQGEPPTWNWEYALKTAILLGISIEEFDYITPYELSLISEAHAEKLESELKERLTLVWLGEYYHRTKKLPSLKEELKKVSSDTGKPKKMTDQQMLETVKRLNAQFGGTFKQGGED
jgi:hypothetical protein